MSAINTSQPHHTQAAAFYVSRPAVQSAPIVLNSPHSGQNYTPDFLKLSRLSATQLRRSEDAYVDELFGFATQMSLPLLAARFPRAFLDVNREPFELDPNMFAEPLDFEINSQSLRVAAGLGTIPRVVGEGQAIYAAKLPLAEIDLRINGLYRPYHRELTDLLDDTHRQFGEVLLLDCHSMPSQPFTSPVPNHPRADFVLGDRFGTSCGAGIVECLAQALQKQGLKVARNKPYAGGFITEHYGHPDGNCHALQIEINRDLYMNEKTYEKRQTFNQLQGVLAQAVQALQGLMNSSGLRQLAAE